MAKKRDPARVMHLMSSAPIHRGIELLEVGVGGKRLLCGGGVL